MYCISRIAKAAIVLAGQFNLLSFDLSTLLKAGYAPFDKLRVNRTGFVSRKRSFEFLALRLRSGQALRLRSGQASTEWHIRITLSERGSLFVFDYLIADFLVGWMRFDADGDLQIGQVNQARPGAA